MSLQNSDLFVIQSQQNNELYKLSLEDLKADLAAAPGVVFKGTANLNTAPGDQTPPVLSPNTGDLYFVESDAPVINAGWSMQGDETSATEGDRIIYNAATGKWTLITSGSATGGTVTGVTASLPLVSDGSATDPVISIRQARTQTAATVAADSKGTEGAIARLAEPTDVIATTGTGSNQAVVTADLLKATNDVVEALSLSPGGVTTVTTNDVAVNNALNISPTSGNVVIELNTASNAQYGVVQIADASAITNGTAGPSAVVDASQLNAAIAVLPVTAIDSIVEGGTNIVAGALNVTTSAVTDGQKDVTIGVVEKTFCPYDFTTLPDITD